MDAEKSYDKYWEDGKHRVRGIGADEFDRWFSPLKNRGRVLDYGCGMGYSYQEQLLANCADYVGADISNRALEDLERKGLAGLKIGPDGSIDAPDASFDAAICCEVMEHLWDPLSAAKELARVIKPGGVLVSTVPNFGYLPFRLLALVRAEVWAEPEDRVNDPFKGVHIRFFSKRNFRLLHQMAGFSSVDVKPFDECNIFHLFTSFNLQRYGGYLSVKLPKAFQLPWLHHVSTSLFANRLRAICIR